MLELKFVSTLEKCFLDQTPADFASVERLRLYKKGTVACQLLVYDGDESYQIQKWLQPTLEGDLAPYVRLRNVELIPNYLPVPVTADRAWAADPKLVRVTPGLYPDLLTPLLHKGKVGLTFQSLRAVWVDVVDDGSLSAGLHTLTVKFTDPEAEDKEAVLAQAVLTVEVINAELPAADTIVTQWFYADCLADYYEVEVFSDRHFEICRNFIKTAVANGMNMILTPILTPPLDTAVGGERTTTQLVGVTVTDGKYRFDFSLLDRWMAMCEACGIRYFEMAHLFTQWGAYHAPKVMATVDGEYRRIFGWETDAAGEEYVTFLREMLTALTAHLRAGGYADRVYFHISDEPSEAHLEQYKINAANVRPYIEGFKQLDALSHVEYYQQGLCPVPVPITDQMKNFLKEDIDERWVYYCCGPWLGTCNRYMSMPSARTRCIGVQMYKYGVKGFLHWGYNFYNDQFSDDVVNPFLSANGGNWVGGGDTCLVYPGRKGQPLESLRLKNLQEGLEDIRVLKLCEQFVPKEELVARMEAICGELNFDMFISDTATMTALRDMLDDIVIEHTK
ncbi:MAG: DUF4091 domain-containing protein [Clostridia bacterium]|nr:DUF4091 domain-containing protein [Clostridia bacterium]